MAIDIQTALGKRIRVLRKTRSWSQEDLAEAAGMHWTYIGQVERGERNLTLQSMHAIARSMHITLAELVDSID